MKGVLVAIDISDWIKRQMIYQGNRAKFTKNKI